MEPAKVIENPVEFMKFFGKVTPYPYQEKFLLSDSRRYTIRMVRQGGKSFMIAVKALYRSFTSPNELILIVSAYQKQSNEVYEHIRNIIEQSDYLRGKIIRFTRRELKWDNMSRIIVLPAGMDGRSSRGYSPTMLIFDEAAYINQEVFDALLPSLGVTNGDLILSSTPFGKSGFFYLSFFGKASESYEKVHIPIQQCPAYSKERIEEVKSECSSDDEFRQEFCAEFIEGADTYFTVRLYNRCKIDTEVEGPEAGKTYILGVDCARQGIDQTVYGIAQVDQKKKTISVVKWLATSKKAQTDIEGRIKYLHEIYRFSRVYIDVSFIGGGVIDHLKEFDKDFPIEGVDFHSKKKSDLYKRLKSMMSKDPPEMLFLENENLRSQMLGMTYSFTSMGILQVKPPPKGFDDFVDVLSILASHKFIDDTDDFLISSG